jgi:hypothetical protein
METIRRAEKIHNEEHQILYAKLNIFGVIKLKTLKWEGHAARIGNEK